LFSAGVPMAQALASVGGAAGSVVYEEATRQIQQDVSAGSSLTAAMKRTTVFPSMALQMSAIGEESGMIDQMLIKTADFYETEVNDMVAGLSSLLEPLIIIFLGSVIGGLVIAMYLPIFQLGQII
ncbi:type II secretion system F family protein, partial [Leptospira sp. SA-E8]|uniref:type II secretion system F family protein n=1 Tax=Leptospira sp. SA-E8 TaxID=3422259 RepID=UPI003EC07424